MKAKLSRRNFIKTGALWLPGAAVVSAQDVVPYRHKSGGGISISAKTLDWATRVQTNGDPYPSMPMLIAVDAWYNGIVSDGLDSDIYDCTFMAPGPTRITPLTPFYRTYGTDPWTYVGGTVTTPVDQRGIATTGSVTCINSGVTPSQVVTGTSFGLSMYSGIANPSGGSPPDFQAGGGGGGHHAYIYSTTISAYTDFQLNWDNTKWGNNPFGVALYGFLSVNRTGANQLDAYGANSVLSWTSLASSASAAAGTLPSGGKMQFGGLNSVSGWLYAYSSSSYWTILCMHKGWSSANAQKFFNRCLTLRMSTPFGGGYYQEVI